MKSKYRVLSMLLTMVLVFTMLPVLDMGGMYEVYASTENKMDIPSGMKTDEEMIELALEYFPEHSERINNPVQADMLMSRGIQNEDRMVVNETKNISDSEQIVYQEYASGRANIIFIVDDNVVETQTGSGYTYKCVDIQVYSWLCAGSMYIDGFAYTIYNNAYDKINNFGYLGLSQLTINTVQRKTNEDANGPAKVVYSSVFGYPDGSFFDGQVMSCALEITVGNNQYSVEAY